MCKQGFCHKRSQNVLLKNLIITDYLQHGGEHRLFNVWTVNSTNKYSCILQGLNKAINFEKILKKNTLTLFTLWPTEVPYTWLWDKCLLIPSRFSFCFLSCKLRYIFSDSMFTYKMQNRGQYIILQSWQLDLKIYGNRLTF